MPNLWRDRIILSLAWILLIRPQKIRTENDVFSRPLASLKGETTIHRESSVAKFGSSDQARLIELLQILLQTRLTGDGHAVGFPHLLILLTCWDEVEEEQAETGLRPDEVLRRLLPNVPRLCVEQLESSSRFWPFRIGP